MTTAAPLTKPQKPPSLRAAIHIAKSRIRSGSGIAEYRCHLVGMQIAHQARLGCRRSEDISMSRSCDSHSKETAKKCARLRQRRADREGKGRLLRVQDVRYHLGHDRDYFLPVSQILVGNNA